MNTKNKLRRLKRSSIFVIAGLWLGGGLLIAAGVDARRPAAAREISAPKTAENKSGQILSRQKSQVLPARSAVFAGAANGTAFILKSGGENVIKQTLKTTKPVFKAFGLSADKRRLLYSPLKNGAPSGELFVEDLKRKRRRRVTSRVVLMAAFSPDEQKIAFVYATGKSFGLAVSDLTTGVERILAAENVYTEMIEWNANGAGIHFLDISGDENAARIESKYAALDGEQSKPAQSDAGLPDAPPDFPVLEIAPSAADAADDPYKSIRFGITEPKIYRFRRAAPDNAHEIIGENFLGTGDLTAIDKFSGAQIALGKGQLIETLDNGAVVKEFTATQTILKFVNWNGAATNLAAAAATFNLPLKNSSMVQGGAGYAAPGSCNLSAHSGTMDYAYDFQTQTVGAHALAAADGLVVFNTADIACNTVSTSCPDYSANGCGGTFFGNAVIIQHADGTFTKYAHLQTNSPQVAVGTNVCQGLYIGRQGHTGSVSGSFNSCGDHLHFQRQTSADILGQSIAVDFNEAASPLSCSVNYVSNSTETTNTIASNAQSFGVSGGSGTVNLTSNSCGWTAASNDAWISVTSPASGSGNAVISYTVGDNSGGGPRTGTMNLGGHIFTVTQAGVQPQNQPPTANAGPDQTILLPASANLSGAATDDNLPNPPGLLTTTWSKISGTGTVAFANADSLNTTANFSTAGVYGLRLTTSDGALSATDDVVVTVNVTNGGGSLTGTQTAPPANINLKTEGTTDWAHWGLNSAASYNRKNIASPQIGNFTPIGTTSVLRYTNNGNSFTWTSGTPTASAASTTTGVYLYNLGSGFQLTVPADTTPRTLKLYVGVWAAGGRLEAVLSDGSASPLVDYSIISPNVRNGVYALNYRAASAGKNLVVRWTVNSNTNAVGNVTLQAATLVAAAAPTPTPTPTPTPVNQPPTVSAGANQTITLPSPASLSGTATDDGLPNPPAALSAAWSKISGAGTVAFASPNNFSTAASFSTAGVYVLRLTANDGALSATGDVTITVNNSATGGALNATSQTTPASVNLTTEGTTDWAHWGLNSAASYNRKNIASPQIGNFTPVGSGSIQQYSNNPNFYSWTDGTPNGAINSTATGDYVIGLNNGFQLTVPADTTPRTLRVYVGLWAAGGKFEAALSDASAANFTDSSLVNSGGTANRIYTINYRAASAGQTMTVKWTAASVFNNWSNVTLQAAALQ